MSINPVVSPSVKSPGVYMSVNLKASAAAPGGAVMRALVMATKSTAGTITADTELKKSISYADAKTLLGTGTPGALGIKRLFEEYPLAMVDLVAPAENGAAVKASGAIVVDAGPPTAARTVRLYVAGRRIETVWAAGENNQTFSERCRDLINQYNENDEALPVTAASAAGVGTEFKCTCTFRIGGPIGNDCRVYVEVIGGAGGTVTAPAGNTLASGTGEPSFANAITTVAGEEYDLRLSACSNADAQDGTASSNPGRVKADIDLNKTGGDAKLQQQVVGATAALSAIKTGAGAMNDEEAEIVFCLNGQSLPFEWACAEGGARLREESIQPNKNRIGMKYRARLYGAYDMNADKPTTTEVEDALNTGVTIVTYTGSGEPRPSRPITTYHKDDASNPDARVLDVGIVTGCFTIAKDLRVALPLEYPDKLLSKNLEPGDDPPPPDVVEERDVKAFVNQRMRFWVSRGVARKDKWDEAVANGSFVAEVNPSDASQLDTEIPASIVRPLAKFGVHVKHYAA